jgi:hypothetical protein
MSLKHLLCQKIRNNREISKEHSSQIEITSYICDTVDIKINIDRAGCVLLRQEDYQLEAYLGYITSSRIVWTTLQNPVIPSFINKQITNELILVVSN